MVHEYRKPGSYVLSYLGRTGINHFRVTAVCGDFYIGGRQFDSLQDLIGRDTLPTLIHRYCFSVICSHLLVCSDVPVPVICLLYFNFFLFYNF